VMQYGGAMLAHTFTGSPLRSMIGLESERTVFERFRAVRRAQRRRATAVELPAGAVETFGRPAPAGA